MRDTGAIQKTCCRSRFFSARNSLHVLALSETLEREARSDHSTMLISPCNAVVHCAWPRPTPDIMFDVQSTEGERPVTVVRRDERQASTFSDNGEANALARASSQTGSRERTPDDRQRKAAWQSCRALSAMMVVQNATSSRIERGRAQARGGNRRRCAYFCLGSRPFSFSMSLTFIFMPPGMMMSPGFWSLLQAPSHFASMVIVVSREPAAPPSACELLLTV
ncbi:hypothetical protein ACVIGA_002726 [Bradyrhizobium sp. USDA 3240]